MPAKSRAEQKAAAIAEHHPDQLYARNRGMANMSMSQLHDFASGSMKGKPAHVKARSSRGGGLAHPHANLGKYLHPKKSR